MSWSMALDNRTGVQLGEITDARERAFSFLLNKPNTINFQVPLRSPLVNSLMSMQTRIRLYQGASLMMHADVIGATRVKSRDEATLSITAVDQQWAMSRRYVGTDPIGRVFPSLTDRGSIARTLIDEAQVAYMGINTNLGIRTGVQNYLSGSTSTYTTGPWKRMDESIRELGLALNGFDWEIVPIEYNAGKVGDWHAAPILGVTRSGVKFGMGPGTENNMASVSDVVDASTMANTVYHIAQSGPDTPGLPTVTAIDVPTTQLYGLHQDIAEANLTDLTLRQALADEHVRVRKLPKRIVTFQAKDFAPEDPRNTPVFGRDFLLGDLVESAASDASGLWFDAYFRVYGWTAKPGSEGLESGELLLVDEG